MTPLRPASFSCTTQLSGPTLLKGPNSRTRIYAPNLRALPVVAAMEIVGVPFNAGGLPSLIKQWRKVLDETQKEVRIAIGDSAPTGFVNLRCSKQVADVFRRHLPPNDVAAWRSLAAAEHDGCVVKADFSQIERRVLSEVTTVTY